VAFTVRFSQDDALADDELVLGLKRELRRPLLDKSVRALLYAALTRPEMRRSTCRRPFGPAGPHPRPQNDLAADFGRWYPGFTTTAQQRTEPVALAT
jgi:hypothetical protein